MMKFIKFRMIKIMKKVTFLPIVLLSATVFADNNAPVNGNTTPQTDPILPLLSFEAQQERATETAQPSEEMLKKLEAERLEAEKQANAQNRITQLLGNNSLQLLSTTAKLYADNEFKLFWRDATATKIFLKEYALFAVSGVSTKSAQALQQILNSSDELARDILLTDSFLDYLYYHKNVSVNADKWLYRLGSYSVKAPQENVIATWLNAVNSGNSAQFVANLVPRNPVYLETTEKVLSLAFGEKAVNSAKKSAKGEKAQNKGTAKNNQADLAKLALNAQRLRIIPDFDNGIFVNIPSYQLYYFRDGKLALQSKVIVGRDDRRTPVMYSKLSNVVVNPPWNVPPTIKAQDLIPKFTRNPALVESSGYEILDRNGKAVNPHSINWAQYKGKEKTFPYHIRQKPGDNAALGLYKFNMPSSDAIYLHDTPNRGLFGKSARALSSGCVRVAKSDELATMLLKEAGWNDSKKQSVLSSRKTTSVPIRSDNPVYLYYVTAWVEGGKVHTLPDIYKYDTQIPRIELAWDKIRTLI